MTLYIALVIALIALIGVWFVARYLKHQFTVIKRTKELQKELEEFNLMLDLTAIFVDAARCIPNPNDTNTLKYRQDFHRFILEVQHLHEVMVNLTKDRQIHNTYSEIIDTLESLEETVAQYTYLKDRFFLEVSDTDPAKNDAVKIKAESNIRALKQKLQRCESATH